MPSKEDLFAKADKYKAIISKARPLSERELKELEAYFKVGLTYSSNAIEGNSFTISETKILIEDGITVGGKSIREVNEVIGHSKAFDYMLELSKQKNITISEEIIKRLHQLFYSGIDSDNAGKYREEQVFISGTEYLPPPPDKVAELMRNFIKRMNMEMENLHPIEYAALLHKMLVDIHPFIDGNGRTARLLMNIILVNKGYGIVSIPPVLRKEYIDTLILAQKNKNADSEPFINLMTECVIETQRDYCRLLRLSLNEE